MKVKKEMPEEVKNLQAPYLILANHVGFWDPFVAGYFLPHFTHFVSSDAVFRNPLLRFFLTRLGTIPKKKNMRDWFDWEEKEIIHVVREKYLSQSKEPIFTDTKMEIFKNDAKGELISIGLADVHLYQDKILVDFYEKENMEFNFTDLQTINPQTKERLEIYYKNDAYRIAGTRPGISALKWEVAVNTIWKEMGLNAKMVPYIRV
jgi:hypothetical protein